MKATTKENKKQTTQQAKELVEATGFKVLTQHYSAPVNIMDYSDVVSARPTDGNGSSPFELELNARMHFISKRQWQDFGVLARAPQLKSNRTGVVDDSRYFEIENDRGDYAQCTMINSAKNVESGGTYGHQKLFKELTAAFNNATENGNVLWIKTTTRNPGTWKSTQGGPENYIWFDGVQVQEYS
jgi:hypothetical protein